MIDEIENNELNEIDINNKENLIKSLSLIIDSLEKNNDYNGILDIIDQYYDFLENDKDKIIILNKKINTLLKKEDYNELLNTLNIKDSIPSITSDDRTIIKFYKAIAYEDLNEVDKAIKILEDIDDNIPLKNNINKYLKISLLYLKQNNINMSKNAYNKALELDSEKKNDIFLLIESDMHFLNEEYYDSLVKFEEFYLRSINKNKYLDRYIKIMTKLKMYDKAYNFYKSSINKPSVRFNSITKYNFYLAVSELLKEINKIDEYNDALNILEELRPKYFKKNEDTINNYITLITSNLSIPLTKYDRYKNIANKFFKLLNGIEYSSLYFIEKTDSSFMISEFNNTQLKETELSNSLLNESNLYDYFNIKEDTILDFFYNNKLERVDQRVKAYVLKNEYKEYGYFFITYNPIYDNTYIVLKNSLVSVYERLDILTHYNSSYNSLLDLMNSKSIGYIKIEGEEIEFYNQYSKSLFNVSANIKPFNVCKTIFKKEIFVDSFLKDELIIETKDNRLYKFENHLVNDAIYSFIKDVTSKYSEEKKKDKYFYNDSMFKSINSLEEKINTNTDSYSLIGLYIPIIKEKDVLSVKNNKLKSLYNLINNISNNSILYYIGENHFIILLSSVDKRVIEHIHDKLQQDIKKMYKESFELRNFKLLGFSSKSLKNKTFEEVSSIIEFGFNYSIIRNEFIILDNETKKNYAIYKQAELEIERDIKNDNLDLEFKLVLDSSNMIHYFIPEYIMPFGIDNNFYNLIINNKKIQYKVDLELINRIIKLEKNLKKNIRFLIPINKESIISKTFIDSLLKLSIDDTRNIVLLLDECNLEEYQSNIDLLYKNKIKLALKVNNFININDTNKFMMVLVDFNDKNINKELSILIKNKYNIEVVVNDIIYDGLLTIKNNINKYNINKLENL